MKNLENLIWSMGICLKLHLLWNKTKMKSMLLNSATLIGDGISIGTASQVIAGTL